MGPLGYVENLGLLKDSKFVLTDSGGIQEETTYLGIPCLTLRKNTERPVTVEIGTNIIVDTDKNKILFEVEKILDSRYKKGKIPRYWDGHTAERIVKVLKERLYK
jgi:UDP-N-acetylglucosamine 2-epimerase (non-hydrolysing)